MADSDKQKPVQPGSGPITRGGGPNDKTGRGVNDKTGRGVNDRTGRDADERPGREPKKEN